MKKPNPSTDELLKRIQNRRETTLVITFPPVEGLNLDHLRADLRNYLESYWADFVEVNELKEDRL